MKTCRYCLLPSESEDPCVRDIPGFPGYRVSCDGKVWSCWNSRWGMTSTWRERKPRLSKKGPPYYQYLGLARGDAGQLNQYVHLLVLVAFVGQRPAGLEGCHNDGNSQNNVVSNLRWDTIVANRADTIAQGKFARGEMYPQAKLTADKVRTIRTRHAAGESPKALAEEYGIHKRNLFRALSGDTWSHVK